MRIVAAGGLPPGLGPHEQQGDEEETAADSDTIEVEGQGIDRFTGFLEADDGEGPGQPASKREELTHFGPVLPAATTDAEWK